MSPPYPGGRAPGARWPRLATHAPTYVPVLPVDAGGLDGLAAAGGTVAARLLPLFDFAPPCAAGRSVEAVLEARLDAIARAHGQRPGLVDGHAADAPGRNDRCAHTRAGDGRLYMAWLLDEARARGLHLIPVTGLRRIAAYQLAVADAASADCRGLALRLELADLRDLDATAERAVTLVDQLGVPAATVDLVVDFGAVAAGQANVLEVTARAVLASLGRAASWRSITVTASSRTPVDLSVLAHRGAEREAAPDAPPHPRLPTAPRNVARDATGSRVAWQLWRALAADDPLPPPGLAGRLRFGDYPAADYEEHGPAAGDAPAAAVVPDPAAPAPLDARAAAVARHLTATVDLLTPDGAAPDANGAPAPRP